MAEWLGWVLLVGLAFAVGCIFALSSQFQRNTHLLMEMVNTQNKLLLDRMDRLSGGSAEATNVVQFSDRRTRQRRSPEAQMARAAVSDDERRQSPGRRLEDQIALTAQVTLRQAF